MKFWMMIIIFSLPFVIAGDWIIPEGEGISSLWTSGSAGDIYYNGGSVGIGLTDPAEDLEITSATTETVIQIDNTGINGDPQLRFSLSGVVKTSLGVDDTGDLFEINYGSDLTTSPEFTLSTSTVTVEHAKFSYGTALRQLGCDATPSVAFTNVIKLVNTVCTYTDFDLASEGVMLIVHCTRPLFGAVRTVQDGGDLFLAGDNDFVCVKQGDQLVLLMVGSDWYEISRAFQ